MSRLTAPNRGKSPSNSKNSSFVADSKLKSEQDKMSKTGTFSNSKNQQSMNNSKEPRAKIPSKEDKEQILSSAQHRRTNSSIILIPKSALKQDASYVDNFGDSPTILNKSRESNSASPKKDVSVISGTGSMKKQPVRVVALNDSTQKEGDMRKSSALNNSELLNESHSPSKRPKSPFVLIPKSVAIQQQLKKEEEELEAKRQESLNRAMMLSAYSNRSGGLRRNKSSKASSPSKTKNASAVSTPNRKLSTERGGSNDAVRNSGIRPSLQKDMGNRTSSQPKAHYETPKRKGSQESLTKEGKQSEVRVSVGIPDSNRKTSSEIKISDYISNMQSRQAIKPQQSTTAMSKVDQVSSQKSNAFTSNEKMATPRRNSRLSEDNVPKSARSDRERDLSQTSTENKSDRKNNFKVNYPVIDGRARAVNKIQMEALYRHRNTASASHSRYGTPLKGSLQGSPEKATTPLKGETNSDVKKQVVAQTQEVSKKDPEYEIIHGNESAKDQLEAPKNDFKASNAEDHDILDAKKTNSDFSIIEAPDSGSLVSPLKEEKAAETTQTTNNQQTQIEDERRSSSLEKQPVYFKRPTIVHNDEIVVNAPDERRKSSIKPPDFVKKAKQQRTSQSYESSQETSLERDQTPEKAETSSQQRPSFRRPTLLSNEEKELVTKETKEPAGSKREGARVSLIKVPDFVGKAQRNSLSASRIEADGSSFEIVKEKSEEVEEIDAKQPKRAHFKPPTRPSLKNTKIQLVSDQSERDKLKLPHKGSIRLLTSSVFTFELGILKSHVQGSILNKGEGETTENKVTLADQIRRRSSSAQDKPPSPGTQKTIAAKSVLLILKTSPI